MAEAAGLALGVLGIAGLFSTCVESFDIVVRAREFSENFELLCTELALERTRLRIWGESLGIVHDPLGRKLPFHPSLCRPDIGHDIELGLTQLSNLLGKADVITGRYVLQEEHAYEVQPTGLTVFRESFVKLRDRIRKNQKQKSVWEVTRWSIHDEPQLERLVSKVRAILDALYNITSALEATERQHVERHHVEKREDQPSSLQDIQNEMLVEEIDSISDPESLALLQEIGSSASAPSSLKVVSESASIRLTAVTSSSKSYYTAQTQISLPTDGGNDTVMLPRHAFFSGVGSVPAPTHTEQSESAKNSQQLPATKDEEAEPSLNVPAEDVPQHRRWIAALASHKVSQRQEPKFTANDVKYGRVLQSVKAYDSQLCESNTGLVLQAHSNAPLARRVFHELRNLRRAEVPYVSAAPVGDSLDKMLASVEGPPGTPYEHGVFWITVKLSEGQAPRLRFQTRVYHPNIDHTGKICADYDTWWQQASRMNRGQGVVQWYARDMTNHYSLGSLLVAICGLLASPNVDDPLVPEIAEIFLTDHKRYCDAAALYTTRYAQGERPTEDELIFPLGENDSDGVAEVPKEYTPKYRSSTVHGVRPDSTESTNTGLYYTHPEQWASLRDEVRPDNPVSDGNPSLLLTTYRSGSPSGDSEYTVVDTNPPDPTPLCYAADRGDKTAVQSLINKGADVNAKSLRGETPLSCAAERGHEAIARLLIDNGADVEATDHLGKTPLFYAADKGHEAVVQLLLDNGVNIEPTDRFGITPLFYAADNGRNGTIQLLIDQGAHIDTKSIRGTTPLFYAAHSGHVATVQLLIDKGADIEATDKFRKTPLSYAAEKGHEATVRLLTEKGVRVK